MIWLIRGDSWLQVIANINQLSLVKSITALILNALPVIGQADTSDTHALSTDLIISSSSKVHNVSILLTLATSWHREITVL